MDYRNTFVRPKGSHHFDQVKKIYRAAGAIGTGLCVQTTAYIRCDEVNRLRSGDGDVMADYTKGYTELILRNGSLVPAVEQEVSAQKKAAGACGSPTA